MRAYTVPAAPFVEILQERLSRIEAAGIEAAPREALSEESGIHAKLLYLLLTGKQEAIAFDYADKIVTNLLGPMAWWTNETLNEVYMSADLAAVDRRWPVTQAVAA